MSEQKKIAIIGAGPSGLASIKSCKEEGFLPVCYERSNEPGGLWRYHDIEGVASVMRTTIINTSKEMSAFSDFPPPKEYPNFMHNSKMFDYFMRYAEHFDLLRHIRCNLEVIKVEPTENFSQTGRWEVSVKSTKTEAITKQTFDAVMVCTGHHVFPKIPTFLGQDKFKGTITHTHSIKSCDQYKGKKVAVVGIGNSGVDAAIDSTYVAEQVYLSTRRGSWINARVGENGIPYDLEIHCRWQHFLASFMSYDKLCDRWEKHLNSKFDHAIYNLKPKHRALSEHPTVNDALPNAILSGRVVIKGNIQRFEEKGIVFCGDDTETEIDAVILATGYHVKFPFLDNNVLKVTENKVHLYKYSIPPHLKHNTFGIIGLIQPVGAIFPISEMQSRWFIQIQAKKLKLPTIQKMEIDISRKNEAMAKNFVESPRHTIQVDYVPFMDELAEMIGAKPNFLKMSMTDPKLFYACVSGSVLPYQYRLVGPHAWSGARNAILTFEERVYAPLNAKIKGISKTSGFLKSTKFLFLVTLSALTLAVSGYYEYMVSL